MIVRDTWIIAQCMPLRESRHYDTANSYILLATYNYHKGCTWMVLVEHNIHLKQQSCDCFPAKKVRIPLPEKNVHLRLCFGLLLSLMFKLLRVISWSLSLTCILILLILSLHFLIMSNIPHYFAKNLSVFASHLIVSICCWVE